MNNRTKVYTFDKPSVYRIKVEGVLDQSWSTRLSGMQIVSDETKARKKVTILFGYLPDQSALSGVLTSLNDLGLTILSVECINEE